MAKKKSERDICSLNEEMLMWCAYRYAIGRKTYVVDLAHYIGQKYYNKLTDERLQFNTQDIREEILRNLSFASIMFTYDGTVSRLERDPIKDFILFINENINSKEDFAKIEHITCYKESYKEGDPKKYRVTPATKTNWTLDFDLDNLIEWDKLASLFDKKNHKKVTVKFNGEIKEYECFEAWSHELIPLENNMYTSNEFKFKRIYISVDSYLSGNDKSYLNEDYIDKVENWN